MYVSNLKNTNLYINTIIRLLQKILRLLHNLYVSVIYRLFPRELISPTQLRVNHEHISQSVSRCSCIFNQNIFLGICDLHADYINFSS